jgi:hypothetical protein
MRGGAIIGRRRPFPVTDDERGPDSVECTPGLLGGQGNLTHADCIMDYRSLYYGFICGCSCHDEDGME